ncbi:MAG: methylaspartate ammonia-lyase [Erysipelothrix sp.]|jgi:methylaspartate ammonia-lyase|nr:methylaspartate ammonia-lyase [Erysipelothrix sp.]
MKIIDVLTSAGKTGFFFDDQKAIKTNAVADGQTYVGTPVTPGFSSVRVAGESISVMLVLEDNQIAFGDCAAVQYSGAGGRDPLFIAKDYIEVIETIVKPLLINQELDSFVRLARLIDSTINPNTQKPLHTALRYGISQALLDGVAKANHTYMADIVAQEYGTEVSDEAINIFMQSGDDRYNNVDKMIIKQADVLPHALINHVPTKLGYKGELLLEYISWLSARIQSKRLDESYCPTLHIDLYGTLGIIFNDDFDKIVDYMKECSVKAQPFPLNLEGPVDMGEREAQISALQTLTKMVDDQKIPVKIVADEWCNTIEDIKLFVDAKAGHMVQIKTPDLGSIHNTIEAVLYCKDKEVLAYQGGTCNETDRSAQVCAHVAMATHPVQMLAKPGMGVDEGFMIVTNEMNRIRALHQYQLRKK